MSYVPTNREDLQEWYSPPELANAAREVMGGIDLDPFSSAEANRLVKAAMFYDKEMNGFEQDWLPRVYAAPMGSLMKLGFVQKFAEEFRMQRTDTAILVVPSLTSAKWFRQLAGNANSIFTRTGRFKFRPGSAIPRCKTPLKRSGAPCMKCVDHKGGHAGAPPAIGEHIVLYFGEDPARFERVFCDSFPGFTTRPTHLGEEII